MNVIDETAPRGFARFRSSAVGMMPIHQRIIETDAQTFGARGIDILAHQITTGSLLGRTIVGQLRIEIAEAFMMLGRHHHVLHARAFGQLRPRARGVWDGLEIRRQLLVFTDRDAFVFHHPFVTAERAVEAPVNKHAKLRFVPPLHAARAIFDRRSCRRAVIHRTRLLAQCNICHVRSR